MTIDHDEMYYYRKLTMVNKLTRVLVWLGIPGLLLICYLAKGEIDALRDQNAVQQRQIAALDIRLDAQERTIHCVAYDLEQVVDQVLARCSTKTPQPLMKMKSRR